MTETAIHGTGSVDPDGERVGILRVCPYCGKKIRWQDFAGLATQSWHYADSIITQAVVSLTDGEEIEHPMITAEQRCGHCQAILTECDFH